jgi:hypothetical protein
MTHGVKKEKLIVFIVGRKKNNRSTSLALQLLEQCARCDAGAQKAGIGIEGSEWRVP